MNPIPPIPEQGPPIPEQGPPIPVIPQSPSTQPQIPLPPSRQTTTAWLLLSQDHEVVPIPTWTSTINSKFKTLLENRIVRVAFLITLIAVPTILTGVFTVATMGAGPAVVIALLCISVFGFGLGSLSFRRKDPSSNSQIQDIIKKIRALNPTVTIDKLIKLIKKDANSINDIHNYIEAAQLLKLPGIDSTELKHLAHMEPKDGVKFEDIKAFLLSYLKLKNEIYALQTMKLTRENLPNYYERIGVLLDRCIESPKSDKRFTTTKADYLRCLREIDRHLQIWETLEAWKASKYVGEAPLAPHHNKAYLLREQTTAKEELAQLRLNHQEASIRIVSLGGLFEVSSKDIQDFERGIHTELESLLARNKVNQADIKHFRERLRALSEVFRSSEGLPPKTT